MTKEASEVLGKGRSYSRPQCKWNESVCVWLGEQSCPHAHLLLSARLDFRSFRTRWDWLGLGGPRGQAWLGLLWMPLPHSPQQRVLKFSVFLRLGVLPASPMLSPCATKTIGYSKISLFPLFQRPERGQVSHPVLPQAS